MKLPLQDLLTIAPFLILVFFTLWIARGAFVSLALYLGTENRRATDASASATPVPDAARPTVARLADLGFTRMGELGHSPLPGQRQPGMTWLLVNGDGSICVELVQLPSQNAPTAIQFNTVYSDDAVLETGYPFGPRINRPDYRSQRGGNNLDEALRHHQAQMADFGPRHGAPRRMRTVADVLAWEPIYRRKYARRKLLGGTIYNLMMPVIMAYMCAITGVPLLADRYLGFETSRLWPLTPILMIPLVAAGVFMYLHMRAQGVR